MLWLLGGGSRRAACYGTCPFGLGVNRSFQAAAAGKPPSPKRHAAATQRPQHPAEYPQSGRCD